MMHPKTNEPCCAGPSLAGRYRAVLRSGAVLCALLLAACNWSTNSNTLTFALSGSINGLTAAGLVLTNGNTTLNVASGATSFTFGQVFTNGTAYGVSVQTSPPGLTCSVAGGVGTFGTSNINNVVVTCSVQAFTLGGTITGLNGSGLVLANGTDTVTVPINTTTFTLPTAVAYTSGYAVTVSSQPTGVSCAVQNGVGTIPASNVTNILVVCSDQPYSLGGTITGLNGPGLVLANGSDTLTVAANATSFTMPTAVAYTSPYAVTIATQPPGLTCTVSNATGTMPAANVTNVVLVCSDQAFTLGGTISGLNGTGLVLANGTDTVTAPVNSTSFTLPTPVAYTSTYTVTVSTQPTGETCTVSAGTGTMPANNVTTVIVACSDRAFTLGGTITGLNGSGLVLANGSDTLTVAANAKAFSMTTGVAFTSHYAVTVKTQPPGETCTVTNGSGVMPASDVTSVSVACTDQSYNLSGTITGLTVNGVGVGGLVLANGSDTLNVPNGATVFTMQAMVPFMSHYAVSVVSSPVGLACTVMNGSGTMPAADVTTVSITCSDQSYNLGGTITGLTVNGTGVSGLVLANGSDTLNVPAGASAFTLPAPVAYTSTYAVSVVSSPVGLTCSVSQGSGTMPAHNVTGVSVTCSGQSYNLGGTISGLTVNGVGVGGLVLANGADTDPIPAGAANFVMPAQVAYGSGYNLTVKTQPPGLSCSVSMGSGTMPAADVNNVSVSCSNQSFNVGGTVTGLTVNGLQLANGSDTVTLHSGDTSFTMPTPVAFGSSYSVSVVTSPTGLMCSVSGGSGTMPAHSVTVAVTCSGQAYNLGGTISGLNGGGLVLANGGDTVSPNVNDTSFIMPTQVAFMSGYKVTVQTQPAGENCAVSGGVGTMPAADVNSVSVSCTDQSFSLGGSISGLTSSGLVLANGADTWSPNPGDTTFTMPTSVPFGTHYNVVVQTQPSGQICSVSSGSGPMPAGNVNGVLVTCM